MSQGEAVRVRRFAGDLRPGDLIIYNNGILHGVVLDMDMVIAVERMGGDTKFSTRLTLMSLIDSHPIQRIRSFVTDNNAVYHNVVRP